MRKVFLGFLVVCSVFIFSSFIAGNKEHDKQLVGIWKGFEKDMQIEGIEKHWIVQRFEDGKYVIMFTVKDGCEIETYSENGQWWTKDGMFYETTGETKDVDSYKYEVMDKIVVNFKSINLNGKARDDYNFSDYKIDLD